MLRENAVTPGILLTCATLLFVSLSTRADADNTQSNARAIRGRTHILLGMDSPLPRSQGDE